MVLFDTLQMFLKQEFEALEICSTAISFWKSGFYYLLQLCNKNHKRSRGKKLMHQKREKQLKSKRNHRAGSLLVEAPNEQEQEDEIYERFLKYPVDYCTFEVFL